MNQITKEALDFVMEAKERFTQDEELTTYRNEEANFIALRSGFREDCMMIYELGNAVGNFVEQLPKQHKVLIDYDEIYKFKEIKERLAKKYEAGYIASEYNDGYKAALLDVLGELDCLNFKK